LETGRKETRDGRKEKRERKKREGRKVNRGGRKEKRGGRIQFSLVVSTLPVRASWITGQLADCRSLHGFKSSFAFVPVRLDVLGVYAGNWVDKI
jgi:hypothetical protein